MGQLTAPQVASEIKSGVKTTEFYFSVAISVCSMIVALGPADNSVVKIAALVVAVASQLGYVASRTTIKS
jgi:hypothetical protein